MNFFGIIIGVTTFMLIGVFHVIVIKCEYFFSKNIWPIFLLLGLAALVGSLFVKSLEWHTGCFRYFMLVEHKGNF